MWLYFGPIIVVVAARPTADACTCNSGYTSSGIALCTACKAGTYKLDPGNSDCTDCEAGQYLGFVGAYRNDCRDCPANTYSSSTKSRCIECPAHSATTSTKSESSNACKCLAGFTGADGSSCTACLRGTYKSVHGSERCMRCPSLAITSDVASADLSECRCVSGATGPDGSACVECAAGTYKAEVGANVCLGCPRGKVGAIYFIKILARALLVQFPMPYVAHELLIQRRACRPPIHVDV